MKKTKKRNEHPRYPGVPLENIPVEYLLHWEKPPIEEVVAALERKLKAIYRLWVNHGGTLYRNKLIKFYQLIGRRIDQYRRAKEVFLSQYAIFPVAGKDGEEFPNFSAFYLRKLESLKEKMERDFIPTLNLSLD